MMTFLKYLVAAIIYFPLAVSVCAETITYSYDAKGRLTKVVKSGGPASGTTTAYEHDKADNRKTVRTSGAPR